MASPDGGTRCFKRPKTYDLDRGRVPRAAALGCPCLRDKTQSRVIARSGTVFVAEATRFREKIERLAPNVARPGSAPVKTDREFLDRTYPVCRRARKMSGLPQHRNDSRQHGRELGQEVDSKNTDRFTGRNIAGFACRH